MSADDCKHDQNPTEAEKELRREIASTEDRINKAEAAYMHSFTTMNGCADAMTKRQLLGRIARLRARLDGLRSYLTEGFGG